MIRYIHNKAKRINDETYIWFIGDCLSTDFKPIDHIYDGSKLFEKDTLKQYVYSFDKKVWELACSGSTSESSSDSTTEGGMNTETGILIVTDTDGVLSASYQDIVNAKFAVLWIDISSSYAATGRALEPSTPTLQAFCTLPTFLLVHKNVEEITIDTDQELSSINNISAPYQVTFGYNDDMMVSYYENDPDQPLKLIQYFNGENDVITT